MKKISILLIAFVAFLSLLMPALAKEPIPVSSKTGNIIFDSSGLSESLNELVKILKAQADQMTFIIKHQPASGLDDDYYSAEKDQNGGFTFGNDGKISNIPIGKKIGIIRIFGQGRELFEEFTQEFTISARKITFLKGPHFRLKKEYPYYFQIPGIGEGQKKITFVTCDKEPITVSSSYLYVDNEGRFYAVIPINVSCLRIIVDGKITADGISINPADPPNWEDPISFPELIDLPDNAGMGSVVIPAPTFEGDVILTLSKGNPESNIAVFGEKNSQQLAIIVPEEHRLRKITLEITNEELLGNYEHIFLRQNGSNYSFHYPNENPFVVYVDIGSGEVNFFVEVLDAYWKPNSGKSAIKVIDYKLSNTVTGNDVFPPNDWQGLEGNEMTFASTAGYISLHGESPSGEQTRSCTTKIMRLNFYAHWAGDVKPTFLLEIKSNDGFDIESDVYAKITDGAFYNYTVKLNIASASLATARFAFDDYVESNRTTSLSVFIDTASLLRDNFEEEIKFVSFVKTEAEDKNGFPVPVINTSDTPSSLGTLEGNMLIF